MRLVLALAIASIVAACALQQSAAERDFVRGDGARMAQAALDAEAIMRGMAQARDASQRLARDVHQTEPDVSSPAVTR